MLCQECGRGVLLSAVHWHPHKGRVRAFCPECDPNVVRIDGFRIGGILFLEGFEKADLSDWGPPAGK